MRWKFLLTFLLFLPLVSAVSGDLEPGTFVCNYERCDLTLSYMYQKGGCSGTGVRIVSGANDVTMICNTVHPCDPGDTCSKSYGGTISLSYGESAVLECCFTNSGICSWSPDNCKWGGWPGSYGNQIGIKYTATYETFGAPTTTVTTTIPTTIPTTTIGPTTTTIPTYCNYNGVCEEGESITCPDCFPIMPMVGMIVLIAGICIVIVAAVAYFVRKG